VAKADDSVLNAIDRKNWVFFSARFWFLGISSRFKAQGQFQFQVKVQSSGFKVSGSKFSRYGYDKTLDIETGKCSRPARSYSSNYKEHFKRYGLKNKSTDLWFD